jgi:hypothetical protein
MTIKVTRHSFTPVASSPGQDRRIETGVNDDYYRREYRRLVKENHQLKHKIKELNQAMADTDTARRQAAQQENTLAIYGDSEEVKALTSRLNVLLPNAQEIGTQGVALVAQIAIAHGLDPLPGSDHVYAWQQGSKLYVVIGYKGLLHLARQQSHFTHQSRPMTTEERQARGLTADQIGYVTEIWEIEKAKACQDAGIPYFPIRGEAVWQQRVQKHKRGGGTYTEYNDPPSGRDGAWVARKNSLKDALRQITSTGNRLAKTLDTMFAEMGRQMALGAGLDLEATSDGWSVALPDGETPLTEEEAVVAGLVPPSDDGADPEPIEGTAVERPEQDTLPTCANCGVEPAEASNPVDPALCATCAQRQADSSAGQ